MFLVNVPVAVVALASPTTESILGALPRAHAGVGSAVNDTTRQVGGTLGVAVLGSVMASVYGGRIADALAGTPLPAEAQRTASASLAAALQVAGRAGGHLGASVAVTAQDAFVAAFHAGAILTGGAALVGAAVALLWLPARATGTTTPHATDHDRP